MYTYLSVMLLERLPAVRVFPGSLDGVGLIWGAHAPKLYLDAEATCSSPVVCASCKRRKTPEKRKIKNPPQTAVFGDLRRSVLAHSNSPVSSEWHA